MRKILYCTGKTSGSKSFLSSSFTKTKRIKNIYDPQFPIVIIDDTVLKGKSVKSVLLQDKICFVRFSNHQNDRLKILKKLDFFDYFTDKDTRQEIFLKIRHANDMLDSRQRIKNLERGMHHKDKKIEKIILLDSLADCYNWRYFVHRAQQELGRARRHLYNISFIGIDIDYFRQLNELYSVKIADNVIREMVQIVKKCLRREDIISRWRDDEFFIILPYTSAINACKVAQRMKDRITTHKFCYKNINFNIRISMGVVSYPHDNVFNSNDVVNALGRCLSNAKRKGGNIVVTSPRISLPKNNGIRKKESNAHELREKIDKMDSLLTRDLLDMIYGFARAIEAKDYYTAKHVESTADIAERVAKELKIPEEEVEDIKRAAILHDLGKVGIDESILSKKGPLNEKEREAVKAHPWLATEILREIHALQGTIPAILYHHERFDGSGYPLGLKGESIPLSARIVAIADVYQALISDRPYRKAFTKRDAISKIRKECGRHFDPLVVNAFLKVIKNEK